MYTLTFSRAGTEDIVLTENDLFDFECEKSCFEGETFELGGVVAKSIHLIIDNNTGRFPRGSFARSRVRLEIDGHFYGEYNTDLPNRRNGVIELNAYDDMIRFDVEFPITAQFPSPFKPVYRRCIEAAGFSYTDPALGDGYRLLGIISHKFTDYIYGNSCRNIISGMTEWNGGFAEINDQNVLQLNLFEKNVSKTFHSSELLDFDYSDETITFSKIKTSQQNKTYELGDDSGYTLVIRNQYISYGLNEDGSQNEGFHDLMNIVYDYYRGFSLTPMRLTLAEPDFDLKLGQRISVIDDEENITLTASISKIVITGNCSMEITCGGFDNGGSGNSYNPTSNTMLHQAKAEAKDTAKYLQTYEGGPKISTGDPVYAPGMYYYLTAPRNYPYLSKYEHNCHISVMTDDEPDGIELADINLSDSGFMVSFVNGNKCSYFYANKKGEIGVYTQDGHNMSSGWRFDKYGRIHVAGMGEGETFALGKDQSGQYCITAPDGKKIYFTED